MKDIVTPYDLFFDQLRDLYSLESQLGASLPKLVGRISHAGLRGYLLHHAEQTEGQRVQLARIFAGHGVPAEGQRCKAMAGIIEGGELECGRVADAGTRDLMIISHCLRIEHYEIAAYGITSRLAGRLGLTTEAGILSAILSEEDFAMKALRELEYEVFQLAGHSRRPRNPVPKPALV